MIPYGRQEITEEDIKAVVDVLRSDFLTQGPQVEIFENLFSKAVDAPFAIAVSNGTAALHLAVLALDVRPGDKVLCTPNTFVASANCILYAGGDVDFIDIDPETFCIDINFFEEHLKRHPRGTYKGVIGVDFAGFPAIKENFYQIARAHGLWVIEDACHAIGGQYKDSSNQWIKVGSAHHADICVFSFHPVKHVTTGEGGMITTRSPELAEKLKISRTHGILRDPAKIKKGGGAWYYEMQELGYNYRLPDILCALGSSQIKRLPENIRRRNEIAEKYARAFEDLPFRSPKTLKDTLHAFHLFVIQSEKRDQLYEFLKTKNIFTQVHYIPVPMHPYYINRYGRKNLPNVEAYYQKALSLPMYHALTSENQDKVIAAVRQFYER